MDVCLTRLRLLGSFRTRLEREVVEPLVMELEVEGRLSEVRSRRLDGELSCVVDVRCGEDDD